MLNQIKFFNIKQKHINPDLLNLKMIVYILTKNLYKLVLCID